jgi:AcrR family transcriptional regulator
MAASSARPGAGENAAAKSPADPPAKGVTPKAGATSAKPAKPPVAAEADPNPYRRSLLRQERSRNTRERLVRAALKLWRKQGFEDTTVGEIAAEADVGWSTFYYHFARKDDVLRELGGLTAHAVEKDLSFEPGAYPDLPSAIDAFVTSMAKHMTTVPREILLAAISQNMESIRHLGDPSLADGVHFTRTLDRLFLNAGCDELWDSGDHTEISAVFTGMLMEGVLRWASGNTKSKDLYEVLHFRATLLLTGIG